MPWTMEQKIFWVEVTPRSDWNLRRSAKHIDPFDMCWCKSLSVVVVGQTAILRTVALHFYPEKNP